LRTLTGASQFCALRSYLDRWCRARTGLSAEPASVALAGPHRYMGGFQGLVHDAGQVILDRV